MQLTSVYIHQSALFQQAPFMSDTSIRNCSSSQANYTIRIHKLMKPFSLYWILLLNVGAVILFIPLLDRVVHPFCFPWVPNMLRRIGIGICISLITIICAVCTEVIRYDRFMSAKSNSIVDVNEYRVSRHFAVDIPVGIMAPQFVIQAVAKCLVLITSKLDT